MKTIVLLAVGIAAMSGLAGAQTITQTFNFNGVPNFNQPLLFNKFAGNPADLQSVQLVYSFTIQGGQFIIDNDADSPATVTANFGASFNANSPDVTLLDENFNFIINGVSVVNSATYNLAANVGDGLNDYDPSGPDGAVLVGTTQNTSGSGYVNSMFLSQFLGAGTFQINAVANQIGSLSYNSGIETATTPVFATGTLTVIYTVPEPSVSLLSGLAIMGLAFRRRR